MKKVLLGFFVGLLFGWIAIVQPAEASGPFKWTNVGGDPCNPKAGCTAEWALGNTGWPKDVQVGLLIQVLTVAPETMAITSGQSGSKDPAWRGWMTWGKFVPKFKSDVIATWKDGQYHPASHWFHDEGDTRYHLMKVRACGNWGGWTTRVAPPPAQVKVVPPPSPTSPMPLGTIPIVACD